MTAIVAAFFTGAVIVLLGSAVIGAVVAPPGRKREGAKLVLRHGVRAIPRARHLDDAPTKPAP